MLTPNDFELRLIAALDDPAILSRYQAGDPLVVQSLRAHAQYLSLLSADIDRAIIEPFIKSKDRTIIADATNKGILPVATPARHQLAVINHGTSTVSLSAGRIVEDGNGGRPWRLLESLTVAAGQTGTVTVEQSTLRNVVVTPGESLPFWRVGLQLQDSQFLASIAVVDAENLPYRLCPRWMNTTPGEAAYCITMDAMNNLFVEFGDSDRAGRTVIAGEAFTISLTETYGEVESDRLRDAALKQIVVPAESRLKMAFVAGGVLRGGSDPLNIAQLRQLASYPALYDENAVFLGNFDFLVRSKFMDRAQYIAVWNEVVQDRLYGASWQDINHLHLAVVAKNPAEQATLQQDIAALIGRADSLFDGRVIVHAVAENPYPLTITGQLAAVHDLDAVMAQIKGLLVERYGRGKLSVSRWNSAGINLQEVSTLIRGQIAAFQDRISDFSVTGPDLQANPIKPHQWAYLTPGSITINLQRTADAGGALWTL